MALRAFGGCSALVEDAFADESLATVVPLPWRTASRARSADAPPRGHAASSDPSRERAQRPARRPDNSLRSTRFAFCFCADRDLVMPIFVLRSRMENRDLEPEIRSLTTEEQLRTRPGCAPFSAQAPAPQAPASSRPLARAVATPGPPVKGATAGVVKRLHAGTPRRRYGFESRHLLFESLRQVAHHPTGWVSGKRASHVVDQC